MTSQQSINGVSLPFYLNQAKKDLFISLDAKQLNNSNIPMSIFRNGMLKLKYLASRLFLKRFPSSDTMHLLYDLFHMTLNLWNSIILKWLLWGSRGKDKEILTSLILMCKRVYVIVVNYFLNICTQKTTTWAYINKS